MSARYTEEARRQMRATQRVAVDNLPRAEAFLLARIEDQIGSMFGNDGWPVMESSMMLSRHLKFNERFRLTTFLLGNGCPPQMIATWYKSRDMLRDHSAVEHVKSIIKAHMTGSLEAEGKTFWSCQATADPKPACLRNHRFEGVGEPTRDKVRPLATPSFAHDEFGQRVVIIDGDWKNGPLEKKGVFFMPPGNSYWLEALDILNAPIPPRVKRQPAFVKPPPTAAPDKVELLNKWHAEHVSARESPHHEAPPKKASKLA